MQAILLTIVVSILGIVVNVFFSQSSGPRFFVCCLPLAFAVAAVFDRGWRYITKE